MPAIIDSDKKLSSFPMALSLDKPKLDNLANEIWKSAERLRGKFKAYEYQNVILPTDPRRERFSQLLRDPRTGRMPSHIAA
jgi:hypothetical protein